MTLTGTFNGDCRRRVQEAARRVPACCVDELQRHRGSGAIGRARWLRGPQGTRKATLELPIGSGVRSLLAASKVLTSRDRTPKRLGSRIAVSVWCH